MFKLQGSVQQSIGFHYLLLPSFYLYNMSRLTDVCLFSLSVDNLKIEVLLLLISFVKLSNYFCSKVTYLKSYRTWYSDDSRKDRARRSKLTNAETLSSRATEGSRVVPVEYIQDFIQHSIDVSSKMLE